MYPNIKLSDPFVISPNLKTYDIITDTGDTFFINTPLINIVGKRTAILNDKSIKNSYSLAFPLNNYKTNHKENTFLKIINSLRKEIIFKLSKSKNFKKIKNLDEIFPEFIKESYTTNNLYISIGLETVNETNFNIKYKKNNLINSDPFNLDCNIDNIDQPNIQNVINDLKSAHNIQCKFKIKIILYKRTIKHKFILDTLKLT